MSFQTSSFVSATTLAGQASIPSQSRHEYEKASFMILAPVVSGEDIRRHQIDQICINGTKPYICNSDTNYCVSTGLQADLGCGPASAQSWMWLTTRPAESVNSLRSRTWWGILRMRTSNGQLQCTNFLRCCGPVSAQSWPTDRFFELDGVSWVL